MPQNLSLTIELVPQPCWYSNMRTNVSRATWDKLRKQIYALYHYRCAVCQVEHVPLHCHEIWHYDDTLHIQKLEGFVALCEMCHHCKHLGHASILAQQGRLDLNKVIEHFMRVNQCSRKEYEAYAQQAWDTWAQRNKYEWTTDLGAYAYMVKRPGSS